MQKGQTTPFAVRKMNSNKKKQLFILAALCLALLAGGVSLGFISANRTGQTVSLFVDADDTPDSVLYKVDEIGEPFSVLGLRGFMTVSRYGAHVHPGRYDIDPGMSIYRLFRRLRAGQQTPVRLVIPASLRTVEALAAKLGANLQADSAAWMALFRDTVALKEFKVDTSTLPCLFIPDTYEVFWTVEPIVVLRKMNKNYRRFWTDARLLKAREAGLSPYEVVTLASIVEQETANEAEKPMVAGMYINRLRQGMKLQADPTVKFALRRFDLRRILHEHLAVESPYNTYHVEGLPPGPICLPSKSSVESVLNYARHPYIYMCAKEDFSGTHNFAATYADHLANARRYSAALDSRGIK